MAAKARVVAVIGQSQAAGPECRDWPRRVKVEVVVTDRNQAMLQMLADGASDKELADAFCVSVRTAKFHVQDLARKFGCGTGRTKLVSFAFRAGLVT